MWRLHTDLWGQSLQIFWSENTPWNFLLKTSSLPSFWKEKYEISSCELTVFNIHSTTFKLHWKNRKWWFLEYSFLLVQMWKFILCGIVDLHLESLPWLARRPGQWVPGRSRAHPAVHGCWCPDPRAWKPSKTSQGYNTEAYFLINVQTHIGSGGKHCKRNVNKGYKLQPSYIPRKSTTAKTFIRIFDHEKEMASHSVKNLM